MLKKILIVIIGLTMTAGLVFATGSPDKPGADLTDTKAPTQVTMMIRDRSSISWEGSDLQSYVQEKFNILIKTEVIDYSAFADKFAIRFNAGDIPDIANFHGLSVEQVNEAGDRGMMLNILDYTDIMPNLKAHFTKYKDDLRFYVSNENSMYFTPLVIPYPLGYFGLGVRKDLLDDAGFDMDKVEDFEDLYKMFSILKQQNGDKPVLGSRYKLGNVMLLGEYMGITGQSVWWNHEKEQWEGTYYRSGMRDFVELMAKMYSEGILHPDFLTMQTKEWGEMLYAGDLTALMDNMAYLTHCMNNRASEDMVWTQVIPPKYEGKLYRTRTQPNLLTGQGKIVSAKTKADKEIMQFLDWLYSWEGMYRTQFGVEGKDYLEIGKEQWIVINDIYKDTLPAEYQSRLLSADEYAKRQDQLPFNLYGLYAFTTKWRAFSKERNPEGTNYYEIAFNDYVAQDVYRGPDPATPFTEEQYDEYKRLADSIQTYGDENVTKMILGQISIKDNWQSFIDGLKKYNYDRFIELHNDSFETFSGKQVDIK